MKRNDFLLRAATLLVAALALTACSDEEDEPKVEPEVPETVDYANYAYIVNNGGWGMNNGTVSLLYANGTDESSLTWGVTDLYQTANGYGIGDAQDLCLAEDKIFVTSTTSSKVEVLSTSGKLEQQFLLPGVQPRWIVNGGDGNVYFTTYSGYVYRMNAKTYAMDSVQVGSYPEALAVAEGSLYANISGYGTGSTVAKVDLTSFKKVKELDVVLNPYSQAIAVDGKVYFISCGNYGSSYYGEPVYSTLQSIDAQTDKVSSLANASVMAYDPTTKSLVCIYSDYYVSEKAAFRYDLSTGSQTSLPSLLEVENAGQVSVDPRTGDIYVVSDDYMSPCQLTVFDKSGNLLRTISGAGYSATKVVFTQE